MPPPLPGNPRSFGESLTAHFSRESQSWVRGAAGSRAGSRAPNGRLWAAWRGGFKPPGDSIGKEARTAPPGRVALATGVIRKESAENVRLVDAILAEAPRFHSLYSSHGLPCPSALDLVFGKLETSLRVRTCSRFLQAVREQGLGRDAVGRGRQETRALEPSNPGSQPLLCI